MGNHVEDLNKYAVRIKEGQRVLGSGVLWKPKSCEQNHIYVFTAAHVIKNHENIEVEFWHYENVVKLSVEKNMIAISKTYRHEGDFEDVGIIALDYTYDNFPSYRFATFQSGEKNICQNKKLIMIGFPKEGHIEQSYALSIDTMEFEYVGVDNELSTLKYRILSSSIDASNRNSEVEGFSGAGVFCNLDSEYVLVGIHKGAIGSNAERGNLLGTTSDFVRKMCCENQYDVPAVINEINGNLSDQREYFREEILVDLELEDMEKVSLLLDEVIGQDMTEAVNGSFYNFCEECHYRTNYHQCNYFRGFLLVLAVFLKVVNENVDLTMPQVNEPKETPIYFVCSEGLGKSTHAKLKLNHFVYALKSQRELAHRLENDCIIIWGSEQSPRDNQKKCTYSEYKNVLRDITRVQGNTLDITSIFKDPKPKAIIHIDEIICMLREGDIQQLQEKFAEYIGELEK